MNQLESLACEQVEPLEIQWNEVFLAINTTPEHLSASFAKAFEKLRVATDNYNVRDRELRSDWLALSSYKKKLFPDAYSYSHKHTFWLRQELRNIQAEINGLQVVLKIATDSSKSEAHLEEWERIQKYPDFQVP